MSSKKEAPAKGPSKNAAKATKGVGQLVQTLLVETDKTYPQIVAAVLAEQPDAKTTARSVASICGSPPTATSAT